MNSQMPAHPNGQEHGHAPTMDSGAGDLSGLFRKEDFLYSLGAFHTLFLMAFFFFISMTRLTDSLSASLTLYIPAVLVYYSVFVIYLSLRIKRLEIPDMDIARDFPLFQCSDALFVALFFIPFINLAWLPLAVSCAAEKVHRLYAKALLNEPFEILLSPKVILTSASWFALAALVPFLAPWLPDAATLPTSTMGEKLLQILCLDFWLLSVSPSLIALGIGSSFSTRKFRQHFCIAAFVFAVAAFPALAFLYTRYLSAEYLKTAGLILLTAYILQFCILEKEIKAIYNRFGEGKTSTRGKADARRFVGVQQLRHHYFEKKRMHMPRGD